MAYFRNFFGMSDDASKDNESSTEIVEKLVERVETSSVYEDRRDALKALRSLGKKMRLQVATIGMNAYMDILATERTSTELLVLTMDTLAAVVCVDDDYEGDDELGERLAEVIVRKKGFISSIIQLIEMYDFAIRRAAVQLLAILLKHRASEVQEGVISEPAGVSRMVDLLHDTREVIRNSSVLMLSELSRANTQIQQLLAYDNTFQLLLDIIDIEPSDSIVIEDCLFVILNLLRKNSSNQQLFREASLIQRISLVLRAFLIGKEGEEEDLTGDWSKQKTANVIFILQVLRSLVSPQDNAQSNIHAAQKIMLQTGILADLCNVLFSEQVVTVDVLVETVIAVGELIRGNYTNQQYLSSGNLTTDAGNRPALQVLLISMTAEKQPFKLRSAVFYCFLCYLHNNEFGKTKIIETLLSTETSDESNSVTTGQCICSAIMSSESIQVWMGCVCLMHCLLDTDHLKQQLLRVQLTAGASEHPVSLLQQVCSLLVSLGNRKPQMRAGILMLLNVWLYNCPVAVSQLLQLDDTVQYLSTHIDECSAEGSDEDNQLVKGLMALLLAICLQNIPDDSEKKDSFNLLVERRIGKEVIAERIDGISRSEHYVRAAQRPQPTAKTTNEMLVDYRFAKLFKTLEGVALKMLRPDSDDVGLQPNESKSGVLASFKELIKRQDEEIASLAQQIKNLTASQNLQNNIPETTTGENKAESNQVEAKCAETVSRSAQADVEAARAELEQYKNYAALWQAEAIRYRQWAEQWQQYQVAQLTNPSETMVAQLTAQLKEVEDQLQFGWQSYEVQMQLASNVNAELLKCRARVEELEAQLSMKSDPSLGGVTGGLNGPGNNGEAVAVASDAEREVAALKKEQEDLLVLLADQDSKIAQYRRRLIDLGQEVTDDEDDAT